MVAPLGMWAGHRASRSMLAVYARHAAAAAEWPGDLRDRTGLGAARRALAVRLDAIAARVRADELSAYRAHLGQVIRNVSPLLLRLCGRDG